MTHIFILNSMKNRLKKVSGEDYHLCIEKLSEVNEFIKSKEDFIPKKKKKTRLILGNQNRDQHIINMRIEGHTYKDIGKLHDISQNRAMQIYEKHLRSFYRLKKMYERTNTPILETTNINKTTYYFTE